VQVVGAAAKDAKADAAKDAKAGAAK
jgi:hypothetical protein